MTRTKHFTAAVRFRPTEIKRLVAEAEGFNAKVAVLVTEGVGTMACAYLFCLLALLSLPENLIQAKVLPASAVPHVLANPGLILLVAWVAQTFLQLVLLSIILVGQSVQSRASDERAEKTLADAAAILDALDVKTEGGLQTILNAIEREQA